MSFSQLAFELFGWGTHKTDGYDNLTMHQVLRLMYIDQETPSNKLFRAEPANADSESTRTAIAEFLLSLDDLESHKTRQRLLSASRAMEKATSELSAIHDVLGRDAVHSEDELTNEMQQVISEMGRLNDHRQILVQPTDDVPQEDERYLNDRVAQVSAEIDALTIALADDEHSLSSIIGELSDCKAFQITLAQRKQALLESRETYQAIGAVTFKHCPSCQSEIDALGQEGICSLCKSPYSPSDTSESYLQVLTELQFHEKQNLKVMADLEARQKVIALGKQLRAHELISKKALLRSIAGASTKREQLLAETSRKMGFLEAQLEALKEKISIVQKLDRLRQETQDLASEISRLNQRLLELGAASADRRTVVMESISTTALRLLELDEDYEDTFKHATKMEAEIDFAKDRWLIDGRSKFSASSNVLKKNALHAAILVHAIKDKDCRHPRFLILDDIENGGMTPSRSQNFQRVLSGLFDGMEDEFQLIVSTAMVDPSLNNDQVGVGRYYNKGDYVIKLP
ncbi:MAG: hypothetical protein EKK46_11020 [Rhodocyclaceae bacterium]|nr:MAG: hypothetical protein EKK46_11020 [Rhodocyclaceae bacterium]